MTNEDTTSGGNADVEFTLIQANRTVSKAFALDEMTGLAIEAEFDQAMRDGSTRRMKVSDGKLNEGKAFRMRLSRVADLVEVMGDLTEKNLIVAGRIACQDIGDEARIMSEGRRNDFAAKGRDVSAIITRSKEDLAYAPGPCLLGLDHDAGRLPLAYRDRLAAAGGAWSAMTTVCAALREVEALLMGSSSNGILRAKDGGVARVSGSLHCWMIATQSADLRAFVECLHERLILAGWGWVFISEAGTPEVRSLVDVVASGVGERVWFSGPPLLKEGLVRQDGARTPRMMGTPGVRLDCASALEPLNAGERIRLEEMKTELISAHAEEIAARKAAHREKMRAKMEARGASPAEIERRFGGWDKHDLDGEALLYLDDGTGIEVAEVLRDPVGFLQQHGDGVKVTMRDPLEPDYHGPTGNVAVLDVANGQTPSVFSHAHGGQTFMLGWSLDDMRREAEAAAAAAAADGQGRVGAVAMALLPMWVRRLGGVDGDALDGALEGLGIGAGDLFLWEYAEVQAGWVTGLASGASVGVPDAALGLHGGEPEAGLVASLAGLETLAEGAAADGPVAGLREALDALWREAGEDDAEGAQKLRDAVLAAQEAEREAQARRASLDDDPDGIAGEAGEGSGAGAGEGVAGAAPAEGAAGAAAGPDDEPMENWSQGPGLKRSTQHAAVNALLRGLRLDRGKLMRDIRAGDVLLRGVREGSEAWRALRLAKTQPAFIEPLTGKPVWVWTDDMTNAAVGWCQRNRVVVTSGVVLDAVLNIADNNAVDPVASYLQRLERSKAWDGAPRLDGWLVRHAGAEEGPVAERALAMFMLAAVARALFPVEGRDASPAQVDTVLVLTGPQGGRKSAALRILARLMWWHSESIVGNLTSKDNLLNVHRAWITDISEGTSLKKSDVTAIKQFISTPMDTFRPPYGRLPAPKVRRGVLACTINDGGDGFLADVTGARRFLVVGVERMDTEVLKLEVDQLWAEAVARYRAGEAWWVREEAEDGTPEAELRDALAVVAGEKRVKTTSEGLVERFIHEDPATISQGRVSGWETRSAPLSVIPAKLILDVLEEVGLDPLKDEYSPAKAGRALTALGWVKLRLKGSAEAVAGLQRDDYIWVSRAGADVRGRTGKLTKASRFPGWLQEQADRGAIYQGRRGVRRADAERDLG